jgi:N-methylhydantoinase B
MEFDVQLLRGNAVSSALGDRGRFAPYGLHGGGDGAKCEIEYTLEGKSYIPEHITKDEGVKLVPGDSTRVATPGGGGWGDPLAREPAAVLRDVVRGFITAERAREDYRVVVAHEGGAWSLDAAGTDALRAPKPVLARSGA